MNILAATGETLANGDTVHAVLTMPQPAGEHFFIGMIIVTGLLVLWSLCTWRKNGGVLFLVLLASFLACGMEGLAEYMAMNYHPEIGGHIAYRAFGMPVPVHVVLSYVLYFGVTGWGLLHAVQRGRSAASWWRLAALGAAVVSIPDFINVNTDVWTYYGHQTLVVLNFPITFIFCDIAAVFAFGAVLHLCLNHFTGGERLLTLIVAPLSLAMAWMAVCLPIGGALHSDADPALTAVAGCASIAISIAMIHACIRYFIAVAGIQVVPALHRRRSNAVAMAGGNT